MLPPVAQKQLNVSAVDNLIRQISQPNHDSADDGQNVSAWLDEAIEALLNDLTGSLG